MSADRARSIRDRRSTDTRKSFADSDEFDAPDEVAQPETYRDETRTRVVDWIKRHKFRAILYSSLILVAAGLGIILSLRYLPELWSSPIVRWAVILGVPFLLGVTIGIKRILATLGRADWKVDRHPDGVVLWLGEWQEGTNGFVAYRGFTFFGSPASSLEVGDLGDQYLHHQAASVSGDDDLVIGYPEAFTAREDTWFGTVAVTLTRGYDVYENGEDIHVFARAPEQSHQEDLDSIDEELSSLNRENQRLRNRIDDLKDPRADHPRTRRDGRHRRRRLLRAPATAPDRPGCAGVERDERDRRAVDRVEHPGVPEGGPER